MLALFIFKCSHVYLKQNNKDKNISLQSETKIVSVSDQYIEKIGTKKWFYLDSEDKQFMLLESIFFEVCDS